MTDKQKQIIAGLSIALVSATSTIAVIPKDKVVEVREVDRVVYEMPRAEYDALKNLLFQKLDEKEAFTFSEYQILVKVIDSEIKKKGGVELEDLKKTDDVLQQVTDEIQAK